MLELPLLELSTIYHSCQRMSYIQSRLSVSPFQVNIKSNLLVGLYHLSTQGTPKASSHVIDILVDTSVVASRLSIVCIYIDSGSANADLSVYIFV